jgi:hypothetical protein
MIFSSPFDLQAILLHRPAVRLLANHRDCPQFAPRLGCRPFAQMFEWRRLLVLSTAQSDISARRPVRRYHFFEKIAFRDAVDDINTP